MKLHRNVAFPWLQTHTYAFRPSLYLLVAGSRLLPTTTTKLVVYVANNGHYFRILPHPLLRKVPIYFVRCISGHWGFSFFAAEHAGHIWRFIAALRHRVES
jgi:hypothetical protein